jgi:hypothetical protein
MDESIGLADMRSLYLAVCSVIILQTDCGGKRSPAWLALES